MKAFIVLTLLALNISQAMAGVAEVRISGLKGSIKQTPELKIKSVQVELGIKNLSQYVSGRLIEMPVKTDVRMNELTAAFQSQGGVFRKRYLLEGSYTGCYVTVKVKVQDKAGKTHTGEKYLVDVKSNPEEACVDQERLTFLAQAALEKELVPVLLDTPNGLILYLEE